jgi:hypothetical protein
VLLREHNKNVHCRCTSMISKSPSMRISVPQTRRWPKHGHLWNDPLSRSLFAPKNTPLTSAARWPW